MPKVSSAGVVGGPLASMTLPPSRRHQQLPVIRVHHMHGVGVSHALCDGLPGRP